jgi:hypothetical protein
LEGAVSEKKSGSSARSGGISLLGLMFLIFLTLKLAGIGTVATWSWWAVTAPLWGGFALVLVVAAVGFTGLLLWGLVASIFTRRKRR